MPGKENRENAEQGSAYHRTRRADIIIGPVNIER